MRIVIVGAGVVGFHLAEQLTEEGHDISVVDSDPELVARLDEKLDVLAVSGDAETPSILKRAGVEGAALVVAVTDRDGTNIVVSLIARKLGAEKRIVRVRNSEFTEAGGVLSKEDLGADVVINSIDTTAHLLTRLVRNPGATDYARFAEGDLSLWGFTISEKSPLNGIRLKGLPSLSENLHALIAGISRHDGTYVIPDGDTELHSGDNIYVFIHRGSTKEFRALAGPERHRVTRLLISGASQLAIDVALRLESRVKSITLIEPDRELAESASRQLKKTLVLCGEVGDPDLCKEYSFGDVDYYLALDDNDETNLMNAMLLKKEGVEQIAILAQEPRYLPILRSLDLGVIVNPRLLTVSAILRHIRRGSIFQVSRLGESGAEAREYAIVKNSPMIGRDLKSITFPTGTILGAIYRKDQYMIPTGDSVLEADDHVVIFALPSAMDSVEKLFSKRKLFSK